MKVKDVMITDSQKWCSLGTKLHVAAKTMSTIGFGALPVVDKEKKVLGIITDRDICLSLAKNHATPIAKTTVSQIMPKTICTVKATDDISTAFTHMQTNKIGHLPVVDEQGRLKGIVSLHNLVNDLHLNKKTEFGDVSVPGESLMRTIQAINNLYNSNDVLNIKNSSPVKKAKGIF
jgi:predicted transcriptional regulator